MTITSAEEFVRLRTSERPENYRRAASEEASLDVWREVIAEHPDMRFWVAQNKTVPAAIIEVLAKDADIRVREMVARKRSAPAGVLARLARDESLGVRLAVARNAATPRDVLGELSGDGEARVAAVAAERLAGTGR